MPMVVKAESWYWFYWNFQTRCMWYYHQDVKTRFCVQPWFIFATQSNFYACFIVSLFLPYHKIPKKLCIYFFINRYCTPDLNILKQSNTLLHFEILSRQMNLTQSWLTLLSSLCSPLRHWKNCLTHMWKCWKQVGEASQAAVISSNQSYRRPIGWIREPLYGPYHWYDVTYNIMCTTLWPYYHSFIATE